MQTNETLFKRAAKWVYHYSVLTCNRISYTIFKMVASNTTIVSLAVILCLACAVQAGTPLVGYGSNTFNEIFSTGFQNGLGGYGAGTVAGAIGAYGQFTGIGTVGIGQALTAGKGYNPTAGGGSGGSGFGGFGPGQTGSYH
ncbi:Uncharacterized protein APZ42_015038 [Daphnia magna]|uniref:Uncharacterized protein n=2 Tax=Daphnia magna TaxID=35525 RepID=A0A162P4X0_9CRUS|nr:Uncharacterized protein APZ42_015038 [Daphnia magna]